MCRLTSCKVNIFISNTTELLAVYKNFSADSKVLAKEIIKNFKGDCSHTSVVQQFWTFLAYIISAENR